MRPLQSLLPRIGLTLSAVAAAVLIVDAKVKVEAQTDKTFAFALLSTYAWPPDAGTLVAGRHRISCRMAASPRKRSGRRSIRRPTAGSRAGA